MRSRHSHLLLFLILAVGLVVRVDNVWRPPFELQPARQFRDAVIARAIYASGPNRLSPAERHLALTAAESGAEPVYEAPVLEAIAAVGYQWSGGEHLWIPRLVAITAWLIGGAFLFLLMQRMRSDLAAAVATLYYVLTPFGIIASRAIMPDPLMVCGVIVNAYLLYQRPVGPGRFAAALSVSSLTGFIKPQAVALLIPTFIALALSEMGFRQAIFRWSTVAFFVGTLLPSAAWLLSRGAGAASGVFFAPSLFFNGFFWDGWFRQLALVVGIPQLLAAMLGMVLFARGRPAALVLGIGAGCLVLALAFDYRVATHDYYSLPVLPLVAIGLGLAMAAPRSRRRAALQGLALTGFLLTFVVEGPWIDPSRDAFDSTRKAAEFGQIGMAVAHTDSAIILAPVDERALEFYGWVAGRRWPSTDDSRVNRLGGVANTPTSELLAQAEHSRHARWFIITDLPDLRAQPSLEAILRQHRLAARGSGYLIYDLDNPASP